MLDKIDNVMNSSAKFQKYTNLLKHEDIVQYLQEKFPTYDIEINIRELVYMLKNGIEERPNCANGQCSNKVNFYPKIGYPNTCSQRCAGILKLDNHHHHESERTVKNFLLTCNEVKMTDEMRGEILSLYYGNTSSARYLKILKNNQYAAALKTAYPDFDTVGDIKTIMTMFAENVYQLPKCKNEKCDKIVTVTNREINDFCSTKCSKVQLVASGGIVENRKKASETYMKRTGYDSPMHNPEVISKKNATCIEKYGTIHPTKTVPVKQKQAQTMDERYGGHYSSTADWKEKFTATCIETYGCDNPAKAPEVKKKISEKLRSRTDEEKAVSNKLREENCLRKHGVRHYSQTEMFATQMYETSQERYGVDHFSQSDIVKAKTVATNLKNIGVTNIMYVGIDPKVVDILHSKEQLTNILTETPNIKIAAEKLGVHPSTVADWKNKHGIEIDFSIRSSYEFELEQILEANGISFESNNRKILTRKMSGKELDFFIPSAKLAIEINGLYWHSEEKKGSSLHREKWKECDRLGITLYTIFEDEWREKKDMWISRILHFCGKTPLTKIPARKCEVKKITAKSEVYDFLEKNHIQGSTQVSTALGLYYEDNLVSVMTFSNTRDNSVDTVELSRFCSLSGFQIVGGASKLLKAFIKKNTKYSSIVSFSDNQYSNGSIYNTLGFEFDGHLKADYKYVVNCKRVHKANYRKSAIQKKFKLTDDEMAGKTETELMQMFDIPKIYDCGKKRWKLKIVPT